MIDVSDDRDVSYMLHSSSWFGAYRTVPVSHAAAPCGNDTFDALAAFAGSHVAVCAMPVEVFLNVTVSPTEMFRVGGENVSAFVISISTSPSPFSPVGRSDVHAATAVIAIAASASRRVILSVPFDFMISLIPRL
jgi:hypothetical protein